MFSTSSLQKSVNSLSLVLIGAFASLLAAPLLSTTTQRVESSATQLSISSPTTSETSQPVDSSVIFLGLAAVGGSAAAIILSSKKASHSPGTHQETAIRLEQASPALQKKLLRLVHNDLGTASRLITLAKVKHPNRSTNWYVEKAIYDLERDRGRY